MIKKFLWLGAFLLGLGKQELAFAAEQEKEKKFVLLCINQKKEAKEAEEAKQGQGSDVSQEKDYPEKYLWSFFVEKDSRVDEVISYIFDKGQDFEIPYEGENIDAYLMNEHGQMKDIFKDKKPSSTGEEKNFETYAEKDDEYLFSSEEATKFLQKAYVLFEEDKNFQQQMARWRFAFGTTFFITETYGGKGVIVKSKNGDTYQLEPIGQHGIKGPDIPIREAFRIARHHTCYMVLAMCFGCLLGQLFYLPALLRKQRSKVAGRCGDLVLLTPQNPYEEDFRLPPS